MVLTIAAGLLAIAVVAYLMGDLQSNIRQQEAVLFDQEILRDSRAVTIEIRKELAHQRAAINDSRSRIDELTRRLAAMHDELEKLKRSGLRATSLHQTEGDPWPFANGK
jgi:hypothetical protein